MFDYRVSYQCMCVFSNWDAAEFEPRLLKNIKERSQFVKPRKIQSAAIPFILDEFDLVGHAETGSGKTAVRLLLSFIFYKVD